MIFPWFSLKKWNSMIFPYLELFFAFFKVFHDISSPWAPCVGKCGSDIYLIKDMLPPTYGLRSWDPNIEPWGTLSPDRADYQIRLILVKILPFRFTISRSAFKYLYSCKAMPLFYHGWRNISLNRLKQNMHLWLLWCYTVLTCGFYNQRR